jgi:glycosyltransferase involved in cell wall biosynthesis
MIKVVHLQYSPVSAGSAASRLHKAFLDNDIDSSILSLLPVNTKDKAIKQLRKRSTIIAQVDQSIQSAVIRKNIKPLYGLYSYPILGNNVSDLPQIKNADIIYIHWVQHGFMNLRNFRQIIESGKPVIFFMHDMWTITGGCHHSFGCDKYMSQCNNCPMFARTTLIDWAKSEFNKKLKLFSAYSNIYFVSPSKWLYDCARQSGLTKDKPVFHIPNILGGTIFKPFDKAVAKQILNIDPNETVLAFGAVTVTSPYKGWEYLKKAIELLQGDPNLKNLSVLIFGGEYDQEIADAIPFKTRFMGYLREEYSTALVYNAADVFVGPSLAESFGFTIYEALSCGTPVAAFETGGIPDQIMHKQNGYLARYKDYEDLAEGIKYCLENKVKGYALPGFDTTVTVNKHRELFEHITQASSNI